jgi:hypothetical protein
MKRSLFGLTVLVALATGCFESSDQPTRVLVDGTALPDRAAAERPA